MQVYPQRGTKCEILIRVTLKLGSVGMTLFKLDFSLAANLKTEIYPSVSGRTILDLRWCGMLRSEAKLDLYYDNLGVLCNISTHT